MGMTDEGTLTEPRGHRDAERGTQDPLVELGQPQGGPVRADPAVLH